MVQQVMKFLDETPNLGVKLSVIETLRTVTEGKVNSDVSTGYVWHSRTNIYDLDLRRS